MSVKRTRVKICGVTNLEDALRAEALGADALGFNLYAASPRYVEPALLASFLNQLGPKTKRIGVFVNADVDFVAQVLGSVPIDCLQFHGDETPAYCGSFNKPYIKAIRATNGDGIISAAKTYSGAEAILLDSVLDGQFGGTGTTFDWSIVPTIMRELGKPLILAGGLNAANVGRAITEVRPDTVDVSGGVEIQKGRKDPAKLEAFFAAVHAADSVS